MDRGLIEFAKDAIRRFLERRPEAADTLEGIHHWWIDWPGHAESQVVTEVALEQLHAEGLIEPLRIGNNVLWRRRREDAAD
ncbi:hypothetical protein [Lysobacter brunescens]|uniref:Uncharacterized protein n=1 Tax=Lysobacter brunescens TaxID=262323 RepID=A0ABW2YFR8_9GAMM